MRIITFVLLAVVAAGQVQAQTVRSPATKVDPAVVDAYIKATWKQVPDGWQSRVEQDETQKVCSQFRNDPPRAEADKIIAREQATIVLPSDGNVMGNWKEGEKIAQNGRGGQFSDPPNTVSGGNCYACHQMARAEVSFGTMGPSLLEFGKLRNYDPEAAKQTYMRVFNPQSVLPCSNMPRFGYHKVLTVEQIKDVTAYLMSPDSPVNK